MNLKTGVMCLIIVTLLSLTVAMVAAGNDIDDHRSCNHCGMDRKAYGYSRMMVIYENGFQVGACSLHCAVTEMEEHKGNAVKTLLVADRNSREMVDAKKAIWVLGGTKRGVMTQNPTWAFATQAAAQSFVNDNGGTITGWDAVLLAARADAMSTSGRR